jgi:hypothetical protein
MKSWLVAFAVGADASSERTRLGSVPAIYTFSGYRRLGEEGLAKLSRSVGFSRCAWRASIVQRGHPRSDADGGCPVGDLEW